MIRSLFIAAILCLLQACRPASDQTGKQTDQPRPQLQTISKEGCQIRFPKPPRETTLVDPFVIPLDVASVRRASVDVDATALQKNFTVTTRKDAPDSSPAQPFTQHLDITVEPNWHGTYEMGEILVSFSFPHHPPVVIPIPKATITVREPTQEELALRPDDQAASTPLPPTPPPSRAPYYIAMAVVAALAMLALAWILIRRFRHRRPPQVAEHHVPPHVKALQELEQLLARKLVQEGQVKPFYDRLSEIVRDYIEGRFGLRAPEMTTEEFLLSLRNQSPNALSPRHSQLIDAFMNHTDLVKYARQIPCLDEINQTVQAARSFIQETIPVPAESQEAHA